MTLGERETHRGYMENYVLFLQLFYKSIQKNYSKKKFILKMHQVL